jgi:hypothetical protein
MPQPSFDLYQQVFSLSMKANAEMLANSTALDLQYKLKQALVSFFNGSSSPAAPPFIGNWALAWGPVVQTVDPIGPASNAMYVASGQDPDTGLPVYVVAIAATNPNSVYDWSVEDCGVGTVAQWPSGSSLPSPVQADCSTPGVSQGTWTGLNKLLTMQGESSSDKKTYSLKNYLAEQASPDATLIFTGHSLAGALSPALAFYLFPNGTAGSGWKNVYVYPTAGATPGNVAFANAFNAAFPQGGAQAKVYQYWNTALWNALDAVPHAWIPDLMNNIPRLYNDAENPMNPDAAAFISGLVVKAQGLTNGNFYARIQDNPLMGGNVNGSPPKTVEDFLSQLAYQHITAYKTENFMDIEELFPNDASELQEIVEAVAKLLNIPIPAMAAGD